LLVDGYPVGVVQQLLLNVVVEQRRAVVHDARGGRPEAWVAGHAALLRTLHILNRIGATLSALLEQPPRDLVDDDQHGREARGFLVYFIVKQFHLERPVLRRRRLVRHVAEHVDGGLERDVAFLWIPDLHVHQHLEFQRDTLLLRHPVLDSCRERRAFLATGTRQHNTSLRPGDLQKSTPSQSTQVANMRMPEIELFQRGNELQPTDSGIRHGGGREGEGLQ
jgi:hypothetical protein